MAVLLSWVSPRHWRRFDCNPEWRVTSRRAAEFFIAAQAAI
jgi:hypothetical protein